VDEDVHLALPHVVAVDLAKITDRGPQLSLEVDHLLEVQLRRPWQLEHELIDTRH